MFDFWPVYSGERFRASWPSCFKLIGKHIVTDFSLIYPAGKETGKLVSFKLIEKKKYVEFKKCMLHVKLTV